jgi:hypothetical protein
MIPGGQVGATIGEAVFTCVYIGKNILNIFSRTTGFSKKFTM